MLINDSLPMSNGRHLEVCLQLVRNSVDFVNNAPIDLGIKVGMHGSNNISLSLVGIFLPMSHLSTGETEVLVHNSRDPYFSADLQE
jgi:hypothetical protein